MKIIYNYAVEANTHCYQLKQKCNAFDNPKKSIKA